MREGGERLEMVVGEGKFYYPRDMNTLNRIH